MGEDKLGVIRLVLSVQLFQSCFLVFGVFLFVSFWLLLFCFGGVGGVVVFIFWFGFFLLYSSFPFFFFFCFFPKGFYLTTLFFLNLFSWSPGFVKAHCAIVSVNIFVLLKIFLFDLKTNKTHLKTF